LSQSTRVTDEERDGETDGSTDKTMTSKTAQALLSRAVQKLKMGRQKTSWLDNMIQWTFQNLEKVLKAAETRSTWR